MFNTMSDYLANALLKHIFRNTDYTRPANLYLALYSDTPDGTELTGGDYARIAIPTGASSEWSDPGASGRTLENSNDEPFPAATADWSEAVAMAIKDASTGGNTLFAFWLSTLYWTFTAAVSDTFTAPGHSLVDTDRVILRGSSLPTGVSADTIYYVISSATDTFSLSLTEGGAAIDITAVGAGTVHKLVPKTAETSDIIRFAAGQVDVVL